MKERRLNAPPIHINGGPPTSSPLSTDLPMCLGIPGRLIEVAPNESHPWFAEGKAEFGGVVKKVSLAYIPEARVGEYVIVHAGFAISRIDEAEARRVFEYLREMDELAELEGPR